MTKKKKIIISAVCIVVLLVGIITGVIVANLKRYSMKYNSLFEFNKHTQMIEINYDRSSLFPEGETYNNGTRIFHNGSAIPANKKYGIFSYSENKMIVNTEYSSIDHLGSNSDSQKSYFQLNSSTNDINIVDEKGNRLEIFKYDNISKTTTNIKTKNINYSTKKDSVKAKINNTFKDEEIEVKSVSFEETYYSKGLFFYELWNITSTDNITYQNLYEVTNEGHKLVQTLNNEIGIQLDNTDLEISFMTDGQPVLMNMRLNTFNGNITGTDMEIYDINFNLKGKITLSSELLKHPLKYFTVGNIAVLQFKIPTTEKDYDYSETNTDGETKYYNLETYKVSLKNASFTLISFEYLINDSYTSFNNETSLINLSKIEEKTLLGSENFIVNERLQTKKINYEFNHIKKINDDRYIASINNNRNFNIIDKEYDLIAHLEECENVFATNDSIIANDSNYYYVCNTDGVILKKYSAQNFKYLNDEKYYLTNKTATIEGKEITSYYLEQLGYANETPLYSHDPEKGYTFNGKLYDKLEIIANDNLSIIMTVKSDSGTFDYSFFTVDGTHLLDISDLDLIDHTPSVFYHNDDSVVLTFYDKQYLLDR